MSSIFVLHREHIYTRTYVHLDSMQKKAPLYKRRPHKRGETPFHELEQVWNGSGTVRNLVWKIQAHTPEQVLPIHQPHSVTWNSPRLGDRITTKELLEGGDTSPD